MESAARRGEAETYTDTALEAIGLAVGVRALGNVVEDLRVGVLNKQRHSALVYLLLASASTKGAHLMKTPAGQHIPELG